MSWKWILIFSWIWCVVDGVGLDDGGEGNAMADMALGAVGKVSCRFCNVLCLRKMRSWVLLPNLTFVEWQASCQDIGVIES